MYVGKSILISLFITQQQYKIVNTTATFSQPLHHAASQSQPTFNKEKQQQSPSYCEEKSKLKPDSNLFSFSWPGGKNLLGAGVVV